MPATYEPIAAQTTTGTVSSVTFSSVPGTFTDLVLVVAGASTITDVLLEFNSDTASNYSNTYLLGNGSSAFSGRDAIASIGDLETSQSNIVAHIMSYANTSVHKTTLAAAATSSAVIRRVMLWRSTSAISTVKVKTYSGSFDSGVSFALYGIKAA